MHTFPPPHHSLGGLFSTTNGMQPRGMQSIFCPHSRITSAWSPLLLRITVLNKLIVLLCTCYLVLVYCNPYRQLAHSSVRGERRIQHLRPQSSYWASIAQSNSDAFSPTHNMIIFTLSRKRFPINRQKIEWQSSTQTSVCSMLWCEFTAHWLFCTNSLRGQ